MNRRKVLAVTLAGTVLAAGWAMAQETPPPAAGGEPVAVAPAEPVRLTLLDLLMKGGPIMYPLGLCSIVMVAFAIERGLGLRQSKVLPAETLQRIRAALDVPGEWIDPQQLIRDLEQFNDPLARVSVAGLRKANRPLLEIEKAIEDAGGREMGNMRRNCRALSIVASVAPLLGLLGTVTGIIRAFMTVAAKAEAMGRTELLAGGIYEALVCTAVGLAIAIPAVVFYHIYVEKVEGLVAEIDSCSEELVSRIPARA